jgi:hypothetical protein
MPEVWVANSIPDEDPLSNLQELLNLSRHVGNLNIAIFKLRIGH